MAAKSEWMSENKCIAMLSRASCHLVFRSACGSRYHMRVLSARSKNAVFPKVHIFAVENDFFAFCLCATERSPWTQSVACGSFSPAGRDILRPIVIRPRGENLDQPRKLEKHAGDAKIAQRPYLHCSDIKRNSIVSLIGWLLRVVYARKSPCLCFYRESLDWSLSKFYFFFPLQFILIFYNLF